MTANPFDAPQDKTQIPANVPRKRSWGWFAVRWLFIIAGLFLLVALLLPTRRHASEAARRAGCINNIRQIQLAILNYESATGRLPPAYTIDEDGNRLHSWRSLILPYIEEGELYESIDFSKPWDDPANAEARKAVVYPYVCPNSSHEETKTTYLALVGPNHAFSGSEGRDFSAIIKSTGSSHLASIIDAPAEEAVHWMSPYDADADLVSRLNENLNFHHDSMFVVAFLDNHTLNFPLESLDLFKDQSPVFGRETQESL